MARFDAAYVPASAMTIFAHPDDAEFGAAGTLCAWSRAGCEVTMVLCTSGNVGTQDPALDLRSLTDVREAEQREAAGLLGVRHLEFLRYDDCRLQPTLELRRDLVRLIRLHRPEVVICNDPTGWFHGDGYINHPDHRAAATAALEATFPCAQMPLLWPETGPAHTVKAVYVAWGAASNVWIDIGATLGAKVAALRAHASQMGEWDPADTLTSWARDDARTGRRMAKAARKRAERRASRADPHAPPVSIPTPRARYTESYRVMILDRQDAPA